MKANIAKSIAIIFLTTIISTILSFICVWAYLSGYFEKWQNLGSPIEPIERIIYGEQHAVYVKTVNDKVYSCTNFQEGSNCWTNTEWSQNDFVQEESCEFESFHIQRPPKEIVDIVEINYCGADLATQVKFALLRDGDIWVWRFGSAGTASAFFLFLEYQLLACC